MIKQFKSIEELMEFLQNAGKKAEEETLIQTTSAMITENGDKISVGIQNPVDVDRVPRIAIRLNDESEGVLLTINELDFFRSMLEQAEDRAMK